MSAVREARPPINTHCNIDNVPDTLKKISQWVCWRPKWIEKGQKWSKPPKCPDGSPASSTNPDTWSSVDTCLDAQKRDAGLGVGFVVIKENGIVGIDLDHCRDPVTGEIEEWAFDIIRSQMRTYAEVSPSGTGFRLFIRGSIPDKYLEDGKEGRRKGYVEIYGSGRYLTVTGDHLEGTSTCLEPRDTALEEFCEEYFGEADGGGAGDASDDYEGVAGDTDPVTLRAKIKALCEVNDKFKKSWRYQRDDLGGDASRYDLALGSMAAAQGWNDAEITLLWKLWRTENDQNPQKIKRKDYVSGTLRKIRKAKAEPGKPSLTDTGNTERFVDEHGENVRYLTEEKRWILWRGQRWQRDKKNAVALLVKKTVQRLAKEARDTDNESLRKHAFRSESAPRRKALLELAGPECAIELDELDIDPMLLGVRNGVLDLRTGQLREAARADLVTLCGGAEFDPAAECPQWLAFLELFSGGDPEWIAYLQRLCGYVLIGNASERAMFILRGQGDNGKSTVLKVMQRLMGDYSRLVSTDFFMTEHGRGPTDATLAGLRGSRLVTAVEAERRQEWNPALIKQLCGGDRVPGRRLYQTDNVEYLPQFKIVIAVNALPKLSQEDKALLRRIRVMPFRVRLPKSDQRGAYAEALYSELSGILNWCITGCLEWQRDGLREPDAMILETATYCTGLDADQEAPLVELDLCEEWLTTDCKKTPGAGATMKELHAGYRDWLNANRDLNGEVWQPSNADPSSVWFGRKLAALSKKHKYLHKGKVGGERGYIGVTPRRTGREY